MRIGIDARAVVRPEIERVSGVHQYTSAIIAALQRLAPEEIVLFGEDSVVAPVRSIPFIGHHLALPQAVHRAGIDLFFSPTGLLPLGLTVPSVAFIHDLFILKHPEWFPDSVLQQVFTLKLVLPHSVRRARRLLVPSLRVKDDVIDAFPDSREKISVVWEGVMPRRRKDYAMTKELRERLRIVQRHIVSVATVEPRKDLITAIKAFEAVLTARPMLARTLQYVIVGTSGWKSDATFAAIEQVNARWRYYAPEVIRYTGPVTEQEKWILYANAELYLCTSLAEGFGLPPFEAMAVETPVITTPVGAVSEVANDAVIVVDFRSDRSLKREIISLLDSPEKARTLAQKGQHVVQRLTWDRAAKQTLDLLRQEGA